MSSPKQPSSTKRSPPTIRIHRASPEPSTADKRKSSPPETKREPSEGLEPRRTKSLPGSPRSERHHHQRKRSATSAHLATQQDSDESMAGGSSKSSSSSSHRHSSSKKSKSSSSSKDLNWSDVTDPEERRRIQNRIAQRKFREKARENKEKTERETRNLEYAGNSYRIPEPSEFMQDNEVSGLPWGGMNMSHCLQRGHAAESQRSSGRGTYVGDDTFTTGQYNTQYSTQWGQPAPTPSYYGGSSGGEEYYFDDSYYYDPTGQSR